MQLTTKRYLSLLIAFSIAFSPTLRADGAASASTQIDTAQSISSAPEPLPEDTDASLATEPLETQATPAAPTEQDTSSSTLSTTDEEPSDEGAQVGQGSDEQRKAGKRRQLRNIGIAIGAVAVAVIAMILVATNDGHKSN